MLPACALLQHCSMLPAYSVLEHCDTPYRLQARIAISQSGLGFSLQFPLFIPGTFAIDRRKNAARPQTGNFNYVCWAGRYGDRIPLGDRFSAPVQPGPEAHPASYTMSTGSFPGVKRPGHDVDNPPPSIAEVKEKVELYLYSTSGPS